MQRKVRVLGTGGTIAGAGRPGDPDNTYQAGQIGIEDLLAPLVGELGISVEAVQVAQVDSRDMDASVWMRLRAAVQQALSDPSVAGVVITHGTDTLEETAVFLESTVQADKPIVFTAAMRPATSAHADGPANLAQAIRLAARRDARGALLAFGGQAWAAVTVRKVHPFAVQAFSGADAPLVCRWTDGDWTQVSDWPEPSRPVPVDPPEDPNTWPVVEMVHTHAAASARPVRALAAMGVDGLVVSATGNGSLHHEVTAALAAAVDSGLLRRDAVRVASRCISGWVVGEPPHGWPVEARLTPAQARVKLMLDLMAR